MQHAINCYRYCNSATSASLVASFQHRLLFMTGAPLKSQQSQKFSKCAPRPPNKFRGWGGQTSCPICTSINCKYGRRKHTTKTSRFKLRPFFRFFCLINETYRRCVSCLYNRSNRLNTLNPLDT